MAATLTGTPTTNSGSSTTPSVSLPASPANGDLLVVLITHNDGTVTVADNNGATAMTEDYDSGNDAGGMGVAIYTRILTGSEPATLNFTLSATNRWAISAFMVTGQPSSSYYDVAISSYNYEIGDTTPDFTGCTTNTDGALVILFGGIDSSSTTWTGGPGGSFVQIATVNSQQPLLAYYLEKATAGAVSNAACSISAASNSLCMNMFAFKSGAIAYTKSLSDSMGVTDVLGKVSAFNKSVVDSQGITDGNSRVVSAVRSVVDAQGITDVISRNASAIRAVTDSMPITDVVTGSTTYNKAIIDALGITDSLSYLFTINISLADSMGVTDSLARQVSYSKNISDAEGVTDVVARTVAYISGLTDAMGLTDILGRQFSASRSIVDALGVADANQETSGQSVDTNFVATYIGAYYMGLYAPTAMPVTTNAFTLVDSMGISDLITIITATDYGYNPDTSIEQIIDVKLSLLAIDDVTGMVSTVFEEKMKLSSTDVMEKTGSIESVVDTSVPIESI